MKAEIIAETEASYRIRFEAAMSEDGWRVPIGQFLNNLLEKAITET